jgi:hypothetical protein
MDDKTAMIVCLWEPQREFIFAAGAGNHGAHLKSWDLPLMLSVV